MQLSLLFLGVFASLLSVPAAPLTAPKPQVARQATWAQIQERNVERADPAYYKAKRSAVPHKKAAIFANTQPIADSFDVDSANNAKRCADVCFENGECTAADYRVGACYFYTDLTGLMVDTNDNSAILLGSTCAQAMTTYSYYGSCTDYSAK